VALAGDRVYERDGDGKFGSGPGEPNKTDKPKADGADKPKADGPKDGRRTSEPRDAARERRIAAVSEVRLKGAQEKHVAARAEQDAAKQGVNTAIDEQVKVRTEAGQNAAALADDAKAELKKSKAERKQIDKAQDKILRAHGIDPNDDGPNAYYRRPEAERVWRTPEYVANEARETKLARREESLEDHARELRAEARANSRETPAMKKLRAAVAAGDHKAVSRLVDSQDFGAITDAQSDYLGEKGMEFNPPADVDLSESVERHRAAAAKAARAGRAVRAHSREVERRKKRSKDADGDGRTGSAEEQDDDQQKSAKEDA
jgi:hypothetical protein